MMKGDSICFPKGVDLGFNNISGRALGQGKLKTSIILAKCVLSMLLILSVHPMIEDGRGSENAVE